MNTSATPGNKTVLSHCAANGNGASDSDSEISTIGFHRDDGSSDQIVRTRPQPFPVLHPSSPMHTGNIAASQTNRPRIHILGQPCSPTTLNNTSAIQKFNYKKNVSFATRHTPAEIFPRDTSIIPNAPMPRYTSIYAVLDDVLGKFFSVFFLASLVTLACALTLALLSLALPILPLVQHIVCISLLSLGVAWGSYRLIKARYANNSQSQQTVEPEKIYDKAKMNEPFTIAVPQPTPHSQLNSIYDTQNFPSTASSSSLGNTTPTM